MPIQFQVIRDGAVIFKRNFAGGPEEIPGYTAHALKAFAIEQPDISVLDEDIIMRWDQKPQAAD